MGEYIKREAAIRKINGEFPDAHYPSWYAALIEEIPAADVVEVVRCKDCEYFLKTEVNGNGFLICSATDKEIFEDDFCSYGERRSE